MHTITNFVFREFKIIHLRYLEIMPISFQNLKKRTPPKTDLKPAKKSSRFNGLSEEEVKKNTLKDILEPNLDLVFIGINPSLMAAHTGRYYAGPGNHFYKLLYESQLIPLPISYEEDDRLLQYKIGLTNIVTRATRSSADLSKAELKKGATIVQEKLKDFKPKIAIFNGKCIYEEFALNYNKTTFRFGLQPHRVGETALWVVPSSSARCANFPRMQDKLHFYTSLKKYLAFLKGEIEEVNLAEFHFDGKCKQVVPSTSKMWRRKGLSAFTKGGKVANKETICMDTSDENFLSIPSSSEFILKNVKTNNKIGTEKDSSNLEICSSDNTQEVNYNRQEKGTLKKKRQVTKKKVQIRSTINIPQRENSQTIDFVSLIKERLRNKKLLIQKDGEENHSENESL